MTKLYFHAATSSVTGTLPTTIQSALGAPFVSADAATVNRSMDTTIGTTQTSFTVNEGTASTRKVYFTRFCSAPLNMTSLSADTWNYAFAAAESSANANFPSTGTAAVNVTCYIWRPSTGAKIATILDGNSSANFAEPSAISTEKSVFGTFAGGAVSFAANDIICIEVYFSVTNTASSPTATFYYDGTTETNNNNTTVSNHASYIETPGQTLTFAGATIAQTVMIEWEES